MKKKRIGFLVPRESRIKIRWVKNVKFFKFIYIYIYIKYIKMTNYRLHCSIDFDSLTQLHNYVKKMGTHNIQVVDTERIDDKQKKSKQQKSKQLLKTFQRGPHDDLFLPAMTQLNKAFRGLNNVFSSIHQISKGETTSKKKVESKQQKSSSSKRSRPNPSS